MDSLIGLRVWVYWNLHKKCFSVRHKGKVIAHTNEICLKDVLFKVSKAGRERVLREKRKNVHAYVVGEVIPQVAQLYYPMSVIYNPYKFTSFVYKYLEQMAVFKAEIAQLKDGKIVVGSPKL